MLYGAIIGDIVGSIYEFRNLRSTKFQFFAKNGFITDDSCMTIALASAIKQWKEKGDDLSQIAADSMRLIGKRYPDKGYGEMFFAWLNDPTMAQVVVVFLDVFSNLFLRAAIASQEYSNGSGFGTFNALDVVMGNRRNHIRNAFYLRNRFTKISSGRNSHSCTITPAIIMCDCVEDLQADYEWDSSCQRTVPPALQCFFESTDYEDAIRNAISIGGDSDTIGAITGAIAGVYYGVPAELKEQAKKYIPADLLDIVNQFESK